MSGDGGRMRESASPSVLTGSVQPLGWNCRYTVEKFHTPDGMKAPGQEPYEVINGEGNLLLDLGARTIWQRVITANPTTATAGALSAFATGCVLGVSTSASTGTSTEVGLLGSTKNYVAMATSYPLHTTGGTTGDRSCQFKASFGTTKANHAWNEWVVAESSGGTHLNRKAQSLGTKTSAATWDLTVTLTLS